MSTAKTLGMSEFLDLANSNFTPSQPVLLERFREDLLKAGVTKNHTKDEAIAMLVLAGVSINEVYNQYTNEDNINISESVITYGKGLIGMTDTYAILEDRSYDWDDMQTYEVTAHYPDGTIVNPADIDAVGHLKLSFKRKVL